MLLIAGSTAPENFTGVIKDFAPGKLFIVDAAYVGGVPGEAKVVPAAEISGVSFSTHMLPLPVMLKYLESEVCCDVIFIGIQPKVTEQGFFISDEVKKGTERLVEDFHHSYDHLNKNRSYRFTFKLKGYGEKILSYSSLQNNKVGRFYHFCPFPAPKTIFTVCYRSWAIIFRHVTVKAKRALAKKERIIYNKMHRAWRSLVARLTGVKRSLVQIQSLRPKTREPRGFRLPWFL